MEILQPTFMLLGDFGFLPDKDLQLGSILPSAKDSRRPDPRRQLTARVLVDSGDVSELPLEPWAWDSDKSSTNSGGLFADLSILTGIGAGVKGEHGHVTRLSIKCERVIRSTFQPKSDAIEQAVTDGTVSRMLSKATRPSIYIITGIMVAHGANIEVGKSQNSGVAAHASVNVTQTGVPVNTGFKGEVSRAENSTLVQVPKTPFILAYQLLRVRQKAFSKSLNVEDENKWALFSDDPAGEQGSTDELEIHRVTHEFDWNE